MLALVSLRASEADDGAICGPAPGVLGLGAQPAADVSWRAIVEGAGVLADGTLTFVECGGFLGQSSEMWDRQLIPCPLSMRAVFAMAAPSRPVCGWAAVVRVVLA